MPISVSILCANHSIMIIAITVPVTVSLLLLCHHNSLLLAYCANHSIIINIIAMPSQQYNYYHIVPITAPLLILLSSPSPMYQSKDNPSSIIPTVPSSHHCHHCASHGTSLTTVPSSHHCHHCANHIISLTTVPSSHNCPHCVSHIISCLLYTSPSPRDWSASRMPSSA